jgi:site-specific DNA recombinase
MISQLLKGHLQADFVLVHKFNRFARNKYDSALYKKKLKDIDIKVVSVSQKIDDTPEGELLEGFLETIDQYYSANLAVEVRKGLREKCIKGETRWRSSFIWIFFGQ